MKILLLNQAFYPDVVSTSQHLTDFAVDLKRAGHEVCVIAGRRGYDDPSRVFPCRDEYQGVCVRRINYLSFGKKTKSARFLSFASFHARLLLQLMFTQRQDVTVALTSPPLIGFLAALFVMFKGGTLAHWVMDLNPDEAIAAGWIRESSLVSRFLRALGGWAFRQSTVLVALDPHMKRRITERYGIEARKICVLPPWAHDDHLTALAHVSNPFRLRHRLSGKFVVMYSGNHSPCHPLDTVLNAAFLMKKDPGVVFYFIGGGSQTKTVTDFKNKHALDNIVQLPYQPLEKLSESLSAADLHVTVLGKAFAGIVHPCKVYGILSVQRPFVFVGPSESHIGDLIERSGIGTRIAHGDSAGFVRVIETVRNFSREHLLVIQQKSSALKEEFSRKKLSAQLVEIITMRKSASCG